MHGTYCQYLLHRITTKVALAGGFVIVDPTVPMPHPSQSWEQLLENIALRIGA